MFKFVTTMGGFAFSMLTLVLVVGALEAGATLIIRTQHFAVIDDPLLHHVWRPNHRSEHREWGDDNPEYPKSYVHQTNAQGWIRTSNVTLEKPERTWRVFYVGDSFVEGTVPMEMTLPAQIEGTLGPLVQREGWNLEVINTGMSSWSPTLYNVFVRKVLVDYDPDVIVVVVDMTDDYDDWQYRKVARFDDTGAPVSVPGGSPSRQHRQANEPATSGLWSRTHQFLRTRSALYSLVRERNTRMPGEESQGGEAEYARWSWVRHSWDDATQDAVNHTLSMLEGIAEFCEEQGIRLMVTGVPHRQQLGVSASGTSKWSVRPHTLLDLFAAKHGIAYLDGIAAMAPHVRNVTKGQFYYRDDIHMNPMGYQVWGAAHIEAFNDRHNKLLPADAF